MDSKYFNAFRLVLFIKNKPKLERTILRCLKEGFARPALNLIYKLNPCRSDIKNKAALAYRLNNYVLFNYLSIPKRFLNLSTRPPVSTSFCFPVKNGWHFEQISTRIFFFVEPVSITLPQAQVIVVCSYFGWIFSFIFIHLFR